MNQTACSSSHHGHHKHSDDDHAKHHHSGDHTHHHDFSGAEEWAKRFDSPERDAWQQPAIIIEALKLSEGMRVADIGAGTGYFLPHLSTAVGPQGRVFGLDIEPDMVRYMTERAQREQLANTSAALIPTDGPGDHDAPFDRILIVNTWHHIDAQHRSEYTKKLAQLLKPDGLILIVEFSPDAEHGPPKAMRLTPDQVIADFTPSPLQASLHTTKLPRQYIIAAQFK